MCKQLGVTRAGYYKWLRHEKTAEELENERLALLVIEYDDRFNHIFGYRGMTGNINRLNGTSYSEKKVYGTMRKLGIKSVVRPKRRTYRRSTPDVINENILAREFNASQPNEKWVSDITEFQIYERGQKKKLYVCAIRDLYDGSIVSYVISNRNDMRLVLNTFDKAMSLNPGARPLFHSDRGFQYTHRLFQKRLSDYGIVHSMSRVGHCIDNAPMEGFWGIMKTEMFHHRKFETVSALSSTIDKYMKYYNESRYQARYGFQAPLEIRKAAFETGSPKQYPIPRNRRIEKYKSKWSVSSVGSKAARRYAPDSLRAGTDCSSEKRETS